MRVLGGRVVLLCCWLAAGCVGPLPRVSGECWASCGAGQVCNHTSGFCEKDECAAGCPAGSRCKITEDSARCIALAPETPPSVPHAY